VRAAIDAFNRGDVDAAFKDASPDFEYDQTRAVGMDRGMFNLEQFRSLLATFTDSWESFTIGADELIDAGEDVVMPFTNVARGRDRIEVQARGIWVWTTVRLCAPVSIRSGKKPSKPPGCRSRRGVSAQGFVTPDLAAPARRQVSCVTGALAHRDLPRAAYNLAD
jgi:hypothetical protein